MCINELFVKVLWNKKSKVYFNIAPTNIFSSKNWIIFIFKSIQIIHNSLQSTVTGSVEKRVFSDCIIAINDKFAYQFSVIIVER